MPSPAASSVLYLRDIVCAVSAAHSSAEEQGLYIGSGRGFESHRAGHQFRARGFTPASENMRWWARRNRRALNEMRCQKNVPGDAYRYPYRKEHGRDYMSEAGPSVKQPPEGGSTFFCAVSTHSSVAATVSIGKEVVLRKQGFSCRQTKQEAAVLTPPLPLLRLLLAEKHLRDGANNQHTRETS
jgi:hypothetical protein